MKQQPYTPGPWTIDVHGCILGGDGLESVAETYQSEWENCPDSPLRIAGIERAIANGKLIVLAPQMLAVLQRLKDEADSLFTVATEADSLFTVATDSIVHDDDGWHCKSCGMELDTGGTHKADCCASRILDLNHALYAAEEILAKTK